LAASVRFSRLAADRGDTLCGVLWDSGAEESKGLGGWNGFDAAYHWAM
jgi:hypothetical protein